MSIRVNFKMGFLYFYMHTICHRSSDPFYIVSYIHKMGHYFFDTQYLAAKSPEMIHGTTGHFLPYSKKSHFLSKHCFRLRLNLPSSNGVIIVLYILCVQEVVTHLIY